MSIIEFDGFNMIERTNHMPDEISYRMDILDRNFNLGLISEKERDIEQDMLINSQYRFSEQTVNRVRQEYENSNRY